MRLWAFTNFVSLVSLTLSCSDDESLSQRHLNQALPGDQAPASEEVDGAAVVEVLEQETPKDADAGAPRMKITSLKMDSGQQATVTISCVVNDKPCNQTMGHALEVAYRLSEEQPTEEASLVLNGEGLATLFGDPQYTVVDLRDAVWSGTESEALIKLKLAMSSAIAGQRYLVILLRHSPTTAVLVKAQAKITTKKDGTTIFDSKEKKGFAAARKHYQSTHGEVSLLARDFFSESDRGLTFYIYNETLDGKTLLEESFDPGTSGMREGVSFQFGRKSARFGLAIGSERKVLRAGTNRLTLYLDHGPETSFDSATNNQFASLDVTWRDFFAAAPLSTVVAADSRESERYAPIGWFSSFEGVDQGVVTQFEPMLFQ